MTNFAIRTRGYNTDYTWQYNGSIDIDAAQSLGQVLDDSKPGFVIRKNKDNGCALLIGGIIRPDEFDYRGRQIAMQIFIGGITESEARSIAVAVLRDWNTTAGFVSAVNVNAVNKIDGDTKQEWEVNWNKLKQSIKPLLKSASDADSQLTSAWEDDYANGTELAKELEQHCLSNGTGLKIYWGGSPNSKDFYKRLQYEADRFYWDGADKINLSAKREEEKRKRKEKEAEQNPLITRRIIAIAAGILLLILLMFLSAKGCKPSKPASENLPKQPTATQTIDNQPANEKIPAEKTSKQKEQVPQQESPKPAADTDSLTQPFEKEK